MTWRTPPGLEVGDVAALCIVERSDVRGQEVIGEHEVAACAHVVSSPGEEALGRLGGDERLDRD